MTSIVKYLETIGQNTSIKQFDSVDAMISDINIKHPEKFSVLPSNSNDLKCVHNAPCDLKSIHVAPCDLKSIHAAPNDLKSIHIAPSDLKSIHTAPSDL